MQHKERPKKVKVDGMQEGTALTGVAKSGCGRPAFGGGLTAPGHAANTGASCCGTARWRGRLGWGGVGRVGAGREAWVWGRPEGN